ncbi:MAG: hypothetical protein J0H68_10020 [Sphingobacteriia bacterium]|nr:hypothetical protein [Sphingobacteriia bacterium]
MTQDSNSNNLGLISTINNVTTQVSEIHEKQDNFIKEQHELLDKIEKILLQRQMDKESLSEI